MPAALAERRCTACTRETPLVPPMQVRELLRELPQWQLSAEGHRIARSWRVRDFLTALDFFRRIGEIAEAEDHHPDLHLTNYRDVLVELWTHTIGGLSENDFIVAAKIDTLSIELAVR